ncbi:uncharacterized protein LOC62_04G006559 [Vanrija pseudolonga]|uniref:Uncharacterized protein n=1 Tax=Vanrija pseudolonga TaxID=143232 RepID=A0AAF0YDY6_9TREE|nr:hypothetical protein LOC62_04G006559 [Vanrija pseudolonga]
MSSSDQPRFEHADPAAHDPKDSSRYHAAAAAAALDLNVSLKPDSFPEDQRSIANRVEAAIAAEDEDSDSPEVQALKEDPTLPARLNGNEPSRGAKIDAQIQAEEEAELERKGKA